MNIFFEQFKNQQSSDNNCFQQPKQDNWWEQFMKEENINQNEVRANGKQTTKFDTDGTINTNFLQTTYSVAQEGLHTTSNGTHWKKGSENGKTKTRIHNNTIQAFDNEYGWCDIYAVNIDMVKEMGFGKGAVYNSKMHGSIAEIYHENGTISQGIFLDACGMASKSPVIDKWVYNQEKNNEIVSFKVKRQGWDKNNY